MTLGISAAPEIQRESFVRTLKTLLEGDARIVVLEGADGIGKSTLLKQFADSQKGSTIHLVVSAASRWANDPAEVARDICAQTEQIIKNRELPPDTVIDDTLLSRSYYLLTRASRKSGNPVYMILDGLDELTDPEDPRRKQILDLLPFGIEGFRFLLTGTLETMPLSVPARRVAKSYPLNFFTPEETQKYLDGFRLTDAQIREVYEVTKGIPGHLAGVRRLLTDTDEPAELVKELPSELPGLFQLEWRAVNPSDDLLHLLLAVLALGQGVSTTDRLAALTGATSTDVQTRLEQLKFLKLDEQSRWVFALEAYRRYASHELLSFQKRVNELFIDFFLKDPEGDESLTNLPTYLTQANRLAELLTYLSPERFAALYQRAPSLTVIQQKADEGIAAARLLERDSELVRFTIQKGAIGEIAGSGIAVSEVRARAALGDYETALALAEQSPRVEVRLRLLAAIARMRAEQRLPQDSAVTERIRTLYSQVDASIYGNQVFNVALDLFYTSPDLAIELVSEAAGDFGENALDWALASLSIQAQAADVEPTAREQARTMSGHIREKIKDPAAKRLSTEAALILGDVPARQAILDAEKLDSTGDRLYVLQHWMLSNRERPDASEVLDYGIRLALSATGFTANAQVYRQLSACLPFLSDVHKLSYYIGLIDAQRAGLEQLGPVEEFVRLQLLLARAEWKHDHTVARARFLEAYNSIARVKDPVVRLACYARLATELLRTDPDRELDQDALHELTNQELQQGLKYVLRLTAEHFEATRGAIEALASALPDLALTFIKELNIQPRRDLAYGAFVKASANGPASEFNTDKVQFALESITDPEEYDSTVYQMVQGWQRSVLKEAETGKILKLLPLIHRISSAATRARASAQLLAVLTVSEGSSATVNQQLHGETIRSWEALDNDSEKLDVGFDIIVSSARNVPNLAREFVDRINGLKEHPVLFDREASMTARLTLFLAIRSYIALAQHHLDTPADRDRLLSTIGRCGSIAEQARLIGDLALRLFLIGRRDDCSSLVQNQLFPLVNSLSQDDQRSRRHLIVEMAPALFMGAANSALGTIGGLPSTVRDEALERIAWFLLTKTPPADPYEYRPRTGYDINFEDANTIIALLRLMDADWQIYWLIEEIIDSAIGSSYRDNFKRAQRADLVRQLDELAQQKFPNQRFIKHDGYLIAAQTRINRLREAPDAEDPEVFARRARAISNVADGAYVMGIIAASSRTAEDRTRYLREAEAITNTIPMLADRIDRLQLMARMLVDIDPTASKRFLQQAFLLSIRGEGKSISDRRRSLIDMAYRVYPDAVASIVAVSDDDPAKKRVENQLRLYRIKDSLARKQQPPDAPNIANASELASAAWLKLGGLTAGRTQPVPSARVLPLLSYAAELTLSKSYPILAWFIENAVRYSKSTGATRTYVRPLFEASLSSGELAIQTVSRETRRQLAAAQPDARDAEIIEAGERSDALNILRAWIREQNTSKYWIIDPYFAPENVALLALLKEAVEDVEVVILAGKKQSLRGVAPPYELAYETAWRQVSSDDPPTAQIILMGTRDTGKCPVHDRWWLTENGGIYLGTSFGGLGSRVSEIRKLTALEARERLDILAPYLMQTRIEHQGERMTYLTFSL